MTSPKSTTWTEARAESQLHSLELSGMRFGLDRMHRMMTVLGSPERSYDTVHVLVEVDGTVKTWGDPLRM